MCLYFVSLFCNKTIKKTIQPQHIQTSTESHTKKHTILKMLEFTIDKQTKTQFSIICYFQKHNNHRPRIQYRQPHYRALHYF